MAHGRPLGRLEGHYTTIGPKAQTVSQVAFLRNFARGEAYLSDAPTLWDVTFQTAVAQAELEAREYAGPTTGSPSTAGRDAGPRRDHPARADPGVRRSDRPPRRRAVPADLFGQTVTSPVFGVEIPVVAHHLAEPDKGAGIAMCCTFGDLTDVIWWRELDLPVRTVIGRDGRMSRETPSGSPGRRAAAAYEELGGKTAFSAREAMVAKLRETGDLEGEPTPTQRMANFYEKGDKPLEIVTTRQWYIRNGGRDASVAREMQSRAVPRSMGARPHAAPLRQLGRRPQRRLADLSAALLRHPVPGLVPARRRRRARLRPPAPPAARRSSRWTRPRGRPGLHRGAAGQAGRLRRRPRRHGHLGDVRR